MFRIEGNISELGSMFDDFVQMGKQVVYMAVYRSEISGYLCMSEGTRRGFLRNQATSRIYSGDETEYRTYAPTGLEAFRVSRNEGAYLCILHYEGHYDTLQCDLRR